MLTPAIGAPLTMDTEPTDSRFRPVDDGKKAVPQQTTRVSERFRTLDEYLAFLESRSVIDGHWYKEVRPGVYHLETGNYRGPGPDQKVFTRAELLKKYGFER